MAEVRKIIIKSASGYGPAEEAYEDRITVTAGSVAYEYKPHPQSGSEYNVYRKWSYRTNSPAYAKLFRRVAEMAPGYVYNAEKPFMADAGSVTVAVTFADGRRKSVKYVCPGDYFREWFLVIKQMVPACEYVPAALLTSDDYEDKA